MPRRVKPKPRKPASPFDFTGDEQILAQRAYQARALHKKNKISVMSISPISKSLLERRKSIPETPSPLPLPSSHQPASHETPPSTPLNRRSTPVANVKRVVKRIKRVKKTRTHASNSTPKKSSVRSKPSRSLFASPSNVETPPNVRRSGRKRMLSFKLREIFSSDDDIAPNTTPTPKRRRTSQTPDNPSSEDPDPIFPEISIQNEATPEEIPKQPTDAPMEKKPAEDLRIEKDAIEHVDKPNPPDDADDMFNKDVSVPHANIDSAEKEDPNVLASGDVGKHIDGDKKDTTEVCESVSKAHDEVKDKALADARKKVEIETKDTGVVTKSASQADTQVTNTTTTDSAIDVESNMKDQRELSKQLNTETHTAALEKCKDDVSTATNAADGKAKSKTSTEQPPVEEQQKDLSKDGKEEEKEAAANVESGNVKSLQATSPEEAAVVAYAGNVEEENISSAPTTELKNSSDGEIKKEQAARDTEQGETLTIPKQTSAHVEDSEPSAMVVAPSDSLQTTEDIANDSKSDLMEVDDGIPSNPDLSSLTLGAEPKDEDEPKDEVEPKDEHENTVPGKANVPNPQPEQDVVSKSEQPVPSGEKTEEAMPDGTTNAPVLSDQVKPISSKLGDLNQSKSNVSGEENAITTPLAAKRKFSGSPVTPSNANQSGDRVLPQDAVLERAATAVAEKSDLLMSDTLEADPLEIGKSLLSTDASEKSAIVNDSMEQPAVVASEEKCVSSVDIKEKQDSPGHHDTAKKEDATEPAEDKQGPPNVPKKAPVKRVRFTEPPPIARSRSQKLGFSGITKLRRRRERQRHSFGGEFDDVSVVAVGQNGPDRKAQQVLLDELQYLLDGIFKKSSSNTEKQRATGNAVLISSLQTLVKLLLRKENKKRSAEDEPEPECGVLVQILAGQPALLQNIVRRLCSVLGKSRVSDALLSLVLVIIFRSTPKVSLVRELELELLLNAFFRNGAGSLKEGEQEAKKKDVSHEIEPGDSKRKRRGLLGRMFDQSKRDSNSLSNLNALLVQAGVSDERSAGFKTEMNTASYLVSIAIAFVLRFHEDAQKWMRNNRKLDKVVAVLYSCEKVMLGKQPKEPPSSGSEETQLSFLGQEGTPAWIGFGSAMRILEFATLDAVCQRRLACESRVGSLAIRVVQTPISDTDGFLGSEWMVSAALRLCINLCHGCPPASDKFVEGNGHVYVLDCLVNECVNAGLLKRKGKTGEANENESFDIRVLCLAMLASIVNQDNSVCNKFRLLQCEGMDEMADGAVSLVLEVLRAAEADAKPDESVEAEEEEEDVRRRSKTARERDEETEKRSQRVMERKITVGYVCLLIGALVMRNNENRKLMEGLLPGKTLLGVAAVLAEFLEFHHEVGVISGSIDRMYAGIIKSLVEPVMKDNGVIVEEEGEGLSSDKNNEKKNESADDVVKDVKIVDASVSNEEKEDDAMDVDS